MELDFNHDFEGLSKDEIEIKLREYVANAKNDPRYNEDRSFRIRILQVENFVDTMFDIRAEEISAKLMLEIEMDAMRAETEKRFYLLRQPVINELKKDPTNKVLQQTAQHIIQMEKDEEIYDPENWKELSAFD